MNGGGAVVTQRLLMPLGAVTFVFFKPVIWVVACIFYHKMVACHLGEYGSGRDAAGGAVAFYHGGVRHVECELVSAVDPERFGLLWELLEGSLKCEVGRVE